MGICDIEIDQNKILKVFAKLNKGILLVMYVTDGILNKLRLAW